MNLDDDSKKELFVIVDASNLETETKNSIKQDINNGKITDENYLNKILRNEEENQKDLLNYLSLYNKPQNEYSVRLIYKKILSREITTKSQIQNLLNDAEIKLKNDLYQSKDQLDEESYNTLLKKIENKNIMTYALRYEIEQIIEEQEKSKLKSYLNKKFYSKGYGKIKSIINRKIDGREITTEEEIKQIMCDSNKISLIGHLHSKNIPKIKTKITSFEDDIISGKIKNVKQLNKKIDKVQKDDLKTYLSQSIPPGLKEIKEETIKKIENGQIKSTEQIDDIVEKIKSKPIIQMSTSHPRNDVSLDKLFR